MNLKNKKILITGASFIGVHLVGALIEKKVRSIRIVNLTSKHKQNLKENMNDVEFYARDLRDISMATKSVKGVDVVVHLAADHGGRGYVALRQGNTASNFLLDGSVFRACLNQEVEKVFYASSGCVYPNYMQNDSTKKILLKESDVKPPYDSDNVYGWAKLMGELTLRQYFNDFGLKSAVGRFFTVYGPFASESHAVMATIAKAFIKQDPFEVWGNGTQIRNWTYVEDIVRGIVKSLEKIEDATAINLGTNERITVDTMVKLTCDYLHFNPKKINHIKMPTGPVNRVANIFRAKKILEWEPKYSFKEGLLKTIEWYRINKKKDYIKANLSRLLLHD